MIYIGLDISTKTGLAIINPDHKKGTTVFTKQVTSSSKCTGMQRADDIWCQVRDLIEAELTSTIVTPKKRERYVILIEGYGFARTQHLQPLFEVGSVIRYNLYLEGYKYLEVPPTSLKKFVTGKGNVKKEMMLKEVYKRFNIDCDTNDEADAVGLAKFGMALDGKLKLPQANMDALKKFLD